MTRVRNQFSTAGGAQTSRRSLMVGGVAAGIGAAAAAGWVSRAAAQESGEEVAGQPGGKLVVVLPVETDTLENWKAYSSDGFPILRNVQEALLNRDPVTNELVGELATSWELVDDRTWRFTLRQGVAFHNGEPLNAEVAAFGINYTWSPENNFEIIQFIGPPMTATAVDEYTLDVQTESPDPILPARLYFSPLPSAQQVREDPDSLPTNPIGTGPYRFVEWQRGQSIRLERNDDWWGHTASDSHGSALIEEVEYVFREESSVRAAMVSSGEAQLARFLAPEDCATLPVCQSAPSVETLFLRLDTMHPALADVRVREAIAIAIDRQAIADRLLGGGTPASQLVGPSADGYDPELPDYPYDLDRAKNLVNEARTDGVNFDFPLRVITRRGNFLRNDELAEYIASQLVEAGLDARSEVVDPALFNEQAYEIPREEVPEDRGWIMLGPHGNEMMDASATAQSYLRCDGTASTFCDPAVDDAIEKSLPLTGEKRTQALQEVTRMVYDQYGVVPIVHVDVNYGTVEQLDWTPRLDAFMLVKEMTLG